VKPGHSVCLYTPDMNAGGVGGRGCQLQDDFNVKTEARLGALRALKGSVEAGYASPGGTAFTECCKVNDNNYEYHPLFFSKVRPKPRAWLRLCLDLTPCA